MPSRQRRARAVLKRAIADLPDRTYLYHTDVRDTLSGRQVAGLLAGQHDKLVEDLDEWFLHQDADATGSYVSGVVPSVEDRALLGEFDLLVELEDEIRRRDHSDPLRDLLRHTTAPVLRYDLGHDVEPGLFFAGDQAVRDATGDLAAAAGIQLRPNRTAVDELLRNASYGGRLQVLFSTDLERLVDALAEAIPRRIVFTDPTLLVYDRLNGSGMEAPVIGTVSRPLKAADLHVDSGPYSWSDIVGGVSPGSYDTAVAFTPSSQEPDAPHGGGPPPRPCLATRRGRPSRSTATSTPTPRGVPT